MNYISLHTHTTFSVLDGLYMPDVYVKKAKEYGMKALAITDHGTMSGVFDFYDSAKKEGIKPILGMEAYFVDDKLDKKSSAHIILLAKNIEGYKILLEKIWDSNTTGYYYKPRLDWKDLEIMTDKIIMLTGCSNGILAKNLNDLNYVKKTLERLKSIFKDDLYIEYIALENITKYGNIWMKLRELAQYYKIRSVITCDSHYLNKEDYFLHEILYYIREKKTIDEKFNIDKDLYFKNYLDVKNIMLKIFTEKLVDKFLDNTNEIAEKVEQFDIYPVDYILPNIDFDENNFKNMLERLLYEKIPKDKIEIYKQRFEIEYKIIKELNLLKYFYIVYDIVKWAKQQGIEVGYGRGSAGGSLIVYLLGITQCDPIKFDLNFYRFINPTRYKMPDIDVDFQKSRRQEVLEYIKKYGVKNVVPIVNWIKFSFKSALKDVMRIYKIKFQEANEITKKFDENNIEKIPSKYKKYVDIALKLCGNIRQMGKHAAGIIITDKPIYNYIPVCRLNGEIRTGIDGKLLQEKKFLKIDILGLDVLDIINLTLKYIEKYENKKIDIFNIDLNDANVYELFQNADTDNIFQFSTDIYKSLLKEVFPTEFKHLVELNAINRPVPKSVNYHKYYIERRFGVKYESNKIIGKYLKDTYGLLLYQEQLMEILCELLDISFGEADNIRRDIEKVGLREVFNKYKDRLYKKYALEDIENIINEYENVAGYLFNKIHATEYTFITYQTAWLKTYYRKYFNLAVLNIEEDIEKLQKTIDDCYKHRIPLKDYNINEISYDFVLNEKGEIIPGCKILKGLGKKSVENIIKNKPFKNVEDFIKRCKVKKNVLKILYDYDFFKNCFGNIENKKVYNFLYNRKHQKNFLFEV